MLKFIDPYERVARVYPAILISLPFVFTYYSFSVLIDIAFLAKLGSGGLIFLAFIFLMSNIIRYFGKKIEPILWESWNGAPSTRFLRLDDKQFAAEIKSKLYAKIFDETNIKLGENVTGDEKIIQAFAFIRNVLREKDKDGLWIKHNREYGFARNLMGSYWIWIGTSFVLFLTCWMSMKYFPDSPSLLLGAILNGTYSMITIFCGRFILPGLTKGIADRYAEDALMSYLNLQ